jgi:manganese-dependent inorganic pyrophosphatase
LNKPIWVLGHLNPDTDSICAAIGYAQLKQALGMDRVVAGRAGSLNRETTYVLNYFGVEAPPLVNDVRARATDMLRSEYASCGPDTTLQEAGRLMRERQVKTLPVVDAENRLQGLITIGDIARYLLAELDLEELTGSAGRVQQILSRQISKLMRQDGLVSFQDDELVDEIRRVMLESRFRNYPVVDEDDHLLGMVARYDLLALRRREVVLVDHNERSQAVKGVEEAKVLEIIDHHRLGDVQTGEPLHFRSEPVGSTCTIIGNIFQEQGLTVDPRTAGLLCAGILSDTVIFRSPTCTAQDRSIAKHLGDIAGLELESFGRAIFQAGSALRERPAREILTEDFKEFQLGSLRVGVGQVEALGTDGLDDVEANLLAEMSSIVDLMNYDLVLMMLTDIIQKGTALLATGRAERLVQEAFGQELQRHRVFLPGIMSRKKQVIPPLARLSSLR